MAFNRRVDVYQLLVFLMFNHFPVPSFISFVSLWRLSIDQVSSNSTTELILVFKLDICGDEVIGIELEAAVGQFNHLQPMKTFDEAAFKRIHFLPNIT